MEKVIILGSASAVPDEQHQNTHFLVQSGASTVLVDCVGDPIQRIPKTGVELDQITDIILTHFHPDHVSGVPLFLMGLWLLGRKEPIRIYGLKDTLDRMKAMLDLFGWKTWPGFYPVTFHDLPEEEMAPVLETPDLRVFSSPVRHLIPTIGLRMEFPKSGKSLAYSCDTEPCANVVRLGNQVDVLLHEAGGASVGHTAPLQAGEIARQAQAKALYLIHYRTRGVNPEDFVKEAARIYTGQVKLAEDLMEIQI